MNIAQLVQQASAARPHAIALSSGDRHLTYAAFEDAANRLAGFLSSRGIASGSVVPILLERSFDQIVAALAVIRAGAAYLPLDPAWPDQRIRAVMEDSHATLFIAPAHRAASLATGVPSFCPQSDSAAIAAASLFPVAISPEDLAYVIYTSGSTGTPKGVEITHANLSHLIAWHNAAFSVTPESRASHIAGLAFDASVWEVWPYLAAGAAVQLPGPMDDLIRTSPAHLLRWLHDGHITHAFVPTALAEPLIQTHWPDTTLLRFFLTGGDALRAAPRAGLPFTVVNNYGPTECTVVATSAPVDSAGPFPPPIGRPIAGATAYVLDESRQSVTPGHTGELYIGGAGVGRGYRNLPDQTAAAFLPDPFGPTPGARMYRTGDIVSQLPDGQFAFHGRRDNQEKIRGQRIELDEITAVLNRHPAVLFSAVATQLDPHGEKQLVAYILPQDHAAPTPRDLQSHLAGFVSAAMTPSIFVHLRALPLNSSGKLDLSLLPPAASENLLTETESAEDRPPATDLESAVLETVRTLLGATSVGLDDDFFLSGGHSLLGAQLVLKVRSDYGVELTLRDLFESPTAASLAARIEEMILDQVSTMSDEEAEAAL